MKIIHTIRTANNFIFILFKENNLNKTEILTFIYKCVKEFDYFNASANNLEFEVQLINKNSNNDPKNKLLLHEFIDFLPESFIYLKLNDYIKHVNKKNRN